MTNNLIFPKLNLQIFAEGGAGGTGTAGSGSGTGAEGATSVTGMNAASQRKGVKSNPLANVIYGKQDDGGQTTTVQGEKATATTESVQQVDRNAKFEELIKGEYKDLYDARMQDTIQKRLKGSKESEAKLNSLTPTLEMLAKKYGLKDTNDIEALNKAILEDDAYYEEEALEKGVTVEQLKEMRKMERENAELKKQMQEKERKDFQAQQYAQWMQQAQDAKRMYPSLDLNAEAKNPQFLRLLNAGIDVGTAYSVIHKDEIIPAAMQYTAKTVEQKLTNKIIANGARPAENGSSSQSGAVVKTDVSQFTKADRDEIRRRVALGEKIRL
jgi:hypothetical protein